MSKLVIDNDLGFKSVMDDAKKLASEPFVKVGVLGKSGSELATYAGANEFGTRDGRIPERSFIRSTMDQNRFTLFQQAERFLAQITAGSMDPKQALGLLGEFIRGQIVSKITTLQDPPNAPSTIARKGSANPLIDEGRLRQAIAWEVES
jgi:hypothetical protein